MRALIDCTVQESNFTKFTYDSYASAASAAQSFEQAPLTSVIVGSILATHATLSINVVSVFAKCRHLG